MSVNVGFGHICWYIKRSRTVSIYPNHLRLLLQSPHSTNEASNRGQSIYWDIQMDSRTPCLSSSLKRWRWRDVTEIGCDSAKMRLTNILMRKCQPRCLVPTAADRWPSDGRTRAAAETHQNNRPLTETQACSVQICRHVQRKRFTCQDFVHRWYGFTF